MSWSLYYIGNMIWVITCEKLDTMRRLLYNLKVPDELVHHVVSLTCTTLLFNEVSASGT
jgi:hypothetical protein